MKPIFLIIGVLALVLGYLLFFSGKKTASAGTTGAGADETVPANGTPSLGESLAAVLESEPPPSATTCRKNCASICSPCPGGKAFSCGPRCTCKRNCKSSCVKGENYKSIYPKC